MCPHPDQAPLTLCTHCGMVVPAPKPPKTAKPRAAKPSLANPVRTKATAPVVPVEQYVPTAFHVHGMSPVNQGSMRVRRGRVVHEKSAELMAWRHAIAQAAIAAGVKCAPEHVPVRLEATFYWPRPASVKRPFPTAKNDVDKSARALQDAVTGVAYVDDGQVVELIVRKRYADDDHPVGVTVVVSLLDQPKAGEEYMTG